jgi:hypothetical protein
MTIISVGDHATGHPVSRRFPMKAGEIQDGPDATGRGVVELSEAIDHVMRDLGIVGDHPEVADEEQDRRDVEEAERRLSDPAQVPEPFDPETNEEA